MKWSNRSKTADFRSPIYSTVCLLDLELQLRFSPFETFYPRHVQDPITLAVSLTVQDPITFGYVHNVYTVGKINAYSFQWCD